MKIHIQLFVLQTSRKVLKHIIHLSGDVISSQFMVLLCEKKIDRNAPTEKMGFWDFDLKGVAVGRWGSRVLNENMKFCLKIYHFLNIKML